MEFKQLDIKPEGSWVKRTFLTQQAKKTMLFICLGAIAGGIYFYLTEGRDMIGFTFTDIFKSMLLGAFLGFFITNSPCARGRC